MVFAALLLGAANAARMLAEFDLPWHLALGRQIAETWSIPRVDELAYTHSAVRYVAVLADLGLYATLRALGPFGLQLANGCVALAIAVTLIWDAKLRGGPVAMSAAVAAGAMYAISAWTFVRPSTLGFFFTVLTLLLIRIRSRRALASAAALMLVWANVNGSVVLGVAFLAGHGALRASRRDFFPLGAAVGGAALACVNPAGAGLLHAGASIATYDDIVIDWQRTSLHFLFSDAPATGWALLAGLSMIALGKNPDGTWRPPLWDVGLVVLALALCGRVRFVPVAVLLLAPIAASRAAKLFPNTRRTDHLLLVTACLAGPAVAIFDQGTLGVGFDPKNFPEPAVRWIEAAKPSGHMWNFWPFGGYLSWRLFPEQQVLLDGRIGFVHDRDVVNDVVASENDAAAFARLDARFDLQWAVCAAGESRRTCGPIAASNDWRMVFLDTMSAVYVRKTGPNARLADAGYFVMTHRTPPERLLESALTGDRATELAHDGALLREQDPTAARSWFVDACGALAIGDRARFEVARARIAVLAPAHPALVVLEKVAATKWP